jgi:hypothetical protein
MPAYLGSPALHGPHPGDPHSILLAFVPSTQFQPVSCALPILYPPIHANDDPINPCVTDNRSVPPGVALVVSAVVSKCTGASTDADSAVHDAFAVVQFTAVDWNSRHEYAPSTPVGSANTAQDDDGHRGWAEPRGQAGSLGLQRTHDDDPAVLYVPLRHGKHAPSPDPLYLPAEHINDVELLEPAAQAYPAVQFPEH